MFILLPYVVCWHTHIKTVYRYFFTFEKSFESLEWQNNILVFFYLFAPSGVILYAIFDVVTYGMLFQLILKASPSYFFCLKIFNKYDARQKGRTGTEKTAKKNHPFFL